MVFVLDAVHQCMYVYPSCCHKLQVLVDGQLTRQVQPGDCHDVE